LIRRKKTCSHSLRLLDSYHDGEMGRRLTSPVYTDGVAPAAEVCGWKAYSAVQPVALPVKRFSDSLIASLLLRNRILYPLPDPLHDDDAPI